MAFSKDPETYNSEEHQVLIEATTETIVIPCPSAESATHIRHRLYALRRAAINTYDKALLLQGAGKPYEHLLVPLVKTATALRALSIGRSEDKKTLYIGRGAASTDVASVLSAALRRQGKELRSQNEAEAVEAFEKIDFSQGDENEQRVEKTFDRLGYGTEEIIGNKDGKGAQTPLTREASAIKDGEILAKITNGKVLTPDEMRILQAMKHHE